MTNSNDPWSLYDDRLRSYKLYEERRAFWQQMMSSEAGRREMWELLDVSHAFQTQFAHGPSGVPDPLASWFQAGQQSVGATLYHKMFMFAREQTLMMHDECDRRFDPPHLPESPRVPREERDPYADTNYN